MTLDSRLPSRKDRDALAKSIRNRARSLLRARQQTQGSGRLSRSLYAISERDRIGVGSALWYAGMQEFGGTIKPRRKQWLTIPLNREARITASAAATPGLFILKLRGRLFLVKPQGSSLKFMYVLKKRVQRKGVRFMRDARDAHKRQVMDLYTDALVTIRND